MSRNIPAPRSAPRLHVLGCVVALLGLALLAVAHWMALPVAALPGQLLAGLGPGLVLAKFILPARATCL